MEEEKINNNRFYLLLLVMFILSVVMSYFNYKMVDVSIIPGLSNATYDRIIEHTKMLKLLKNKKIKI